MSATSTTTSPSPTSQGGVKRYRPAPAKTFQCRGFGDCRMVFSRSEHLARHVRKHTGERPFTCHCSKQFSRLDNLRQHAQTVHSDKADDNERMMRELTSLHAVIAGKTKGVRGGVGMKVKDEFDSVADIMTGVTPFSNLSAQRPGTTAGYEAAGPGSNASSPDDEESLSNRSFRDSDSHSPPHQHQHQSFLASASEHRNHNQSFREHQPPQQSFRPHTTHSHASQSFRERERNQQSFRNNTHSNTHNGPQQSFRPFTSSESFRPHAVAASYSNPQPNQPQPREPSQQQSFRPFSASTTTGQQQPFRFDFSRDRDSIRERETLTLPPLRARPGTAPDGWFTASSAAPPAAARDGGFGGAGMVASSAAYRDDDPSPFSFNPPDAESTNAAYAAPPSSSYYGAGRPPSSYAYQNRISSSSGVPPTSNAGRKRAFSFVDADGGDGRDAGRDSRPTSRRLSVLELCHPASPTPAAPLSPLAVSSTASADTAADERTSHSGIGVAPTAPRSLDRSPTADGERSLSGTYGSSTNKEALSRTYWAESGRPVTSGGITRGAEGLSLADDTSSAASRDGTREWDRRGVEGSAALQRIERGSDAVSPSEPERLPRSPDEYGSRPSQHTQQQRSMHSESESESESNISDDEAGTSPSGFGRMVGVRRTYAATQSPPQPERQSPSQSPQPERHLHLGGYSPANSSDRSRSPLSVASSHSPRSPGFPQRGALYGVRGISDGFGDGAGVLSA